MFINAQGWLQPVDIQASPNFNQRPNDNIDLVVIHNISLPMGQFGNRHIIDLFCNRLDCDTHPSFASLLDIQVSAHLLIRRDGHIIQFVSFQQRAWHAGVSVYKRRDNCNDYSIGIELEGTDTLAYTPVQYSQLVKVLKIMREFYPKINNRIVGHQEIAPERKTDPGKAFDWDYLWKLL